ncbi:MAG: hypothetical protein GXC76_13430 [Rhodanobacteraceae bacterium]|jgi:hypothetical protein|nr:hypothetical protein [Rhodanobacteraceae bacterium]
MDIFRKVTLSSLLAASFGLVAATAWAQDMSPPEPGKMGGMKEMHEKMGGMHKQRVEGMHAMPATVTTVDKQTGLVEVTAEGMNLRLHFPPATVADLKEGDKISVHMGYSKEK